MDERLKEQRTPETEIAVVLLRDLVSAQAAIYRMSVNPSKEEREALDISRRKFEGTLESTMSFFETKDENYAEAIKAVGKFLKAKHLGVLDAVRVWSNHGQIKDPLHSKAVFDYIRNLGI